MNNFYLLAGFVFLLGCTNQNSTEILPRYLIETKVPLQPGKTQDVLKLFQDTNPALVKDEPDWLRATFSSIENEDVVVVRAEWKSKAAYAEFSNSKKFKDTMGQFGKYFKGKPEVTIAKVLFAM